MGLDMYLSLGNGEDAKAVGYWRKANAIHAYFVNNIQNGYDDQASYIVSKEDFESLFEILNDILIKAQSVGIQMISDDCESMKFNDMILQNCSHNWHENHNNYEDLIKYCEENLPTQSGFFFGSTEYDVYYFRSIFYTHDLIKNILNDWENREDDYYYSCWW